MVRLVSEKVLGRIRSEFRLWSSATRSGMFFLFAKLKKKRFVYFPMSHKLQFVSSSIFVSFICFSKQRGERAYLASRTWTDSIHTYKNFRIRIFRWS